MWCNYNEYFLEYIKIRSYGSSCQTATYFAHERSSNTLQPGSKTCHFSTQKLEHVFSANVVDGDSAWYEHFVLQPPEGPVHVRQRSSPDALFPMMNGNNSERGFSANVKKKSLDDTSAMPWGIHYSKTQKNSLVNSYDLKQSLNCFLVLF